ncbi:MAG: class I tRNA ligase family protein, partial [Acutalibacteraceae bacterium]|nr:class I tRNA ligase family protein [Acutalibacteraceae bacterium]
NTLVTGYDIIPFWVMRMMFSGIEHTGKAPFDTGLIHGLVRDSQGRKMSKSLGNGIDPLEIINKYGADALRLTLATGNAPGNDMRFYDERVEFSSNFANKLWNAARFVHMNIDGHDVENKLPAELATEDKWIISTLNNVAKEVTENLDKFELGIAVQKVFDFIWDCYCDWYIELAKSRLQSTDDSAQNARQVLVWVLDRALRLLHPFMPFITEEIWQTLPHCGDTIMLAKFPEFTADYDFPQAREEMEVVMNGIRAIRTRRSEMNVPPSRKAKVYIATEQKNVFENGAPFICKLASASEVEVGDSFDIEGAVTVITAEAKIYIPMSELVDKEEELQRLNKELAKTEKMLAQSEGKLNNQGFIGKAPANVVEKVKQQAEKEREKIAMLKAAIDALK